VQPPRQLLELLARHRREVCPLHIVEVGVESARHAKRRILFAPIRKPAARLSDNDRIRLIAPVQTRGGVNGYARSLQVPPRMSRWTDLYKSEKSGRDLVMARKYGIGDWLYFPEAGTDGAIVGSLEARSAGSRGLLCITGVS
jgi:hypothetical protein